MIYVWTHTSIAWWIELAFQRSGEIWGTTLQIFAKSPRGRQIPHVSAEQFERGRQERAKRNQTWGLVHSNYLINLSKPFDEVKTEINSVLQDFEVAYELGFDAVNVHIWKGKWRDSLDEAMKHMTENVTYILQKLKDAKHDNVQFLFENTAGQWSEIGSTQQELGYFWNTYLKDLPVKFCIDTAHCRGGWIDVNKREEFTSWFGETIGIEQLYSIHLNDSKAALGSKLDRHASLWRGLIGWPALAKVVRRAAANERNLYIETSDDSLWPQEIEAVKRVAAGDDSWIEEFHRTNFREQTLKKFANGDTVGEQAGLDL